MNKIINIISLFAVTVYTIIVFGNIYDFSFSTFHFRGLGLKDEILAAIAVLVALLGMIRILRRWQGVKDMKNFKSFTFKTKLSKEMFSEAILHSSLEILFIIGFIVLLGFFTSIEFYNGIHMLVVMLIILVDALLFFFRRLRNDDVFSIGINKDIVAYFNREMKIYYFTGLQRIEIHHGLIHLQYKKDLNLFIPTSAIPKAERENFRDQLIATLENRNIFIDEEFRKWH